MAVMGTKAVIDLNAFRDFRLGMAKLRDGEPRAATELLRQAFECDPENAYYASYYGLGLAHGESNWVEAEQLCHTAVCRERRQAQLYLNLAEVYLLSDRRQAAADTLARGLHYLPSDMRLRVAFGQLARRRTPVLPFLPRGNALNRTLGRLRHRLVQVVPRRRWLTVRELRA
jgi:tetratricopeptide (TPR) repeat protein